MSIEAARAFTKTVESDDELQGKVSEATSGQPAENLANVIEIAAGAGFDFSGEELKAAASELDDDQLDKAAGGLGYKLDRCWVKSWTISGDAD
jgi:predicted ribosomally synthesized peptide with nif11-like leader